MLRDWTRATTLATLWAAALCALPAGCEPLELDRGCDQMTVISNKENTVFSCRTLGGQWQELGQGKIIQTPAPASGPREFRAHPRGFREKTLVLAQPVSELRFTFEISDSEDLAAALEADVQAISVITGETAATAKGKASSLAQMRECMNQCAESLAARELMQDKSVAVLTFREGRHADGLGRQAQGMFISALHDSPGNIRIIERERLEAIMAENDLTIAGVLQNPQGLGKLLAVDYLIVGVIGQLD